MRTTAIFAALLMLASSANISRADDYLSGYLDLGYQYRKARVEDHGIWDLSQNENTSTLGGAIQYRLDNCAAGLNISGSSFHENGATSAVSFEYNGTSTTIGAEAGCRIRNLWIIGLGRLSSSGGANAPSEYRTGAYGMGLYYNFNDQYGLGFAAEKQKENYSDSLGSFDYQWMTYAIKSRYFVNDDLMLSSSLEFDRFDASKAYSIFSKIEYKLKDRPVSFYAGLGAEWDRADNMNFSTEILNATVGLRFFFNDGSLKTIVNNSIPDFGD